MYFFFFFFFQAEDGIRDSSVTGVQTCALPISCIPAQLFADRPAEESSVRDFGHFPCLALPEPGPSSRHLAGAAASAGGFGVHSAFCAGDFYRAAATRPWPPVGGNGSPRNAPGTTTFRDASASAAP